MPLEPLLLLPQLPEWCADPDHELTHKALQTQRQRSSSYNHYCLAAAAPATAAT